MSIHHILLIHASADVCFDYFYFLAIKKSTATNLCIQPVFVWTHVFISLRFILKVELLSHMETLCLTFCGTLMLFSVPAMHEDSYFSTSSLALLFCCFDYSIHPGGCKVISHMALIYVFPMTNDVEHLFMGLLAICRSSLEKRLSDPLPTC